MKKIILLIICILAIIQLSFSQQTEKRKWLKKMGAKAYISENYAVLSFPNLNKSLSALNYPTLKHNSISSGGGIYATMGRVMLGGEMYRLYKGGSNDSLEISFNGSSWGMYVGYQIIQNQYFRLYPCVGFGSFGGNFNTNLVAQKNVSSQTLTQFLQNDYKSSTYLEGTNLHFSLGFEYIWRKYFFIGARVGYNYAQPTSSSYSAVSNLPKDKMGGLFGNMMFGVNFWNKKKDK
jgi:hypothetical protein